MKLWPIPPYLGTDDEILARAVHGMTQNNRQVGGDHYEKMDVQPWEAFEAWATPEQFTGYMLLTAQAYLARFNAEGVGKGGVQDVEKAVHTLQKLIEFKTKEGK